MSTSGDGSDGGGAPPPRGVQLPNTVHSEMAACLPLPSLPLLCDPTRLRLRLFDQPDGGPGPRDDVACHAGTIAGLIADADVSYLNLRAEVAPLPFCHVEPPDIYNEVIRCNSEAFECIRPGSIKKQFYQTPVLEKTWFDKNIPVGGQPYGDCGESHNQLPQNNFPTEIKTPSRKPKLKKKGSKDHAPPSIDTVELQDAAVQQLSVFLEEFCDRAESPTDERDDGEFLPLTFDDLKILVNEIVSSRAKKFVHLVPVDILARLIRVLDHQIHRAEGLSVNDDSDSDAEKSVCGALESIHAALAIMAHDGMPKQLYKEEVIERILEFTKHQIGDVMSACDPTYRALHKPNENENFEGYEDMDDDVEFGSASKKRRTFRGAKAKKSSSNRVSDAVYTILQKLCIILGFLKHLLTIERLSDSCILQLLKTSFTTLSVDNIQLLQLKAIDLISGIFYSYPQHRTYVLDEILQLLLKIPFSKKVPRTYHLPDEDHRQIQTVSALLIRLVHSSANLPEAMREPLNANSVIDPSVDASYITKCHEAITETCCLFWSRVLSRLTSTKNQDASELKTLLENLVMDLLTTLYLPEYPASAPILEVLCVLLLQNAGLKSKDIGARSMAIDILGTIAARLKRDSVICKKENFWIVKELSDCDNVERNYPEDECVICMDTRVEAPLFLCQSCRRFFHTDCMGVKDPEIPSRGWFCQFCHCKKEIIFLQSYCESNCNNAVTENTKNKKKSSNKTGSVGKMEMVQQMLLNYVRDGGSADDLNLFIRWFYLCLWFKDDPNCQQKFYYYLTRLKSKEIVRDSGVASSLLTRDSVKKIALALGQYNSFSRGFDKILHMLLASLMENSPVIRAKALRAVSIIVEADPEVLCDKSVQTAVEGKFCDSAISVREAALELVGRHIVSHPDVGLKYFDKVSERIKDTGVSVRKRAIKIIREMCMSNTNFPEFTRACIEIISRVSDEESSVQDLVCKTFHEFWFEEPSGSERRVFGNSSSVPLEVAKKTEQIVETLRKMPNHQNLILVIKRNLALDFLPQSAKAVGINPITLATVRKRCELMCKFLLERILQVEEMTNEEVEIRTVPYVLLLHAFCVLDPTLCAPASDPSQFVVTLQPYLKSQADSRVIAQLLESIIFVIASVLPLLRKLSPNVVEELEQDLKQMIVRHSFLSVVHACIKCLCSLSKLAGKGSAVVEYLIQLFFKRLDALGFDNQQQVARSLFCLGLLIRYGNSLLDTTCSSNIDVKNSLGVFKKYLNGEDFVLKARSLQALGHVLIAKPEFMLEKDVKRILEATLSSGTDVRLKMQALQNIYEYLLDAESQMGTEKNSVTEVTYNVGNGRSVPVAAGAGDTNICGGIIQLYWDNILGRCLDVNEQVRQSAIKIVEVVLRQGLVHPITCVPYLIALETDPEDANSKLAHHLLTNMNEKYPSFFESRLGDGLQMSYIFIKSIAGNSQNSNPKVQPKVADKGKFENGSFNQARHGVSRIYKLIRSNRVSRNKFMSSVVRKFDTPKWNNQVVPFLMYCSEILALLPFTLPDEPLYLIYAINRVIQVRAGPIEANLKNYLHSFQQEVKIVQENGIPQPELSFHPLFNDTIKMDLNGAFQEVSTDMLVSNISESVDHKLHSSNSHDTSESDLPKIQADCLAAVALQLLLKLKRHMKIVYSLNDARCQEFSPTEPLKPSEVLSKQSVPFNFGELTTEMPTSSQEVLQKYQEFKIALKEDTIDYSAYTANIKRKRPPPKRAPKQSRNITKYVEDDDDDDAEDEDWGGGRLSNSGKKSSSRGRQWS